MAISPEKFLEAAKVRMAECVNSTLDLTMRRSTTEWEEATERRRAAYEEWKRKNANENENDKRPDRNRSLQFR